METIQVIKERRAVRSYTDAPIDRATIERLIDAAIFAPSAMNLQPWAFAVLLNRDRIAGYARRIRDWLLSNPEVTSVDPSLSRPIGRDYPKMRPHHLPGWNR